MALRYLVPPVTDSSSRRFLNQMELKNIGWPASRPSVT
jgi:hypothetical protein